MKPRSYQTLMDHVDLMCDYLDVDMLGEIDSDQVQHMLNKLNNAGYSRSIGHKSARTTMEIYTHLNMTEAKNIRRSEEDLKDF